MDNKINQKAFDAGAACALSDACRGAVREPNKRDSKSWAAGYRRTCEELADTFGPNWKEKMDERRFVA